MTTTHARRAASKSSAGASLGTLLREARERAGLSVRELAARMDASPATISDAERGQDPLASTLQRWLDALPALSPAIAFGRSAPRPAASPAAWACSRDAFGFAIAHARFQVLLHADGTRTTLLEATGIRTVRGDVADREQASRALHLLFRGSPEARLELAVLAARTRMFPLALKDGCFEHEFDAEPGRRASLRWTRRQVAGEPPPQGVGAPGGVPISAPFREGLAVAIEHPIGRLEIVAKFADGRMPKEARCFTWTDLQSVSPD
jgi:transcriptional regulator with XRE-family HTH domain